MAQWSVVAPSLVELGTHAGFSIHIGLQRCSTRLRGSIHRIQFLGQARILQ
jgi:hypothetical protein